MSDDNRFYKTAFTLEPYSNPIRDLLELANLQQMQQEEDRKFMRAVYAIMQRECANCQDRKADHIDGKCPFAPTQYRPGIVEG